MARLIRAVQPYCAETLVAAMPCTRGHSDSTGSSLFRARSKEPAPGARPRDVVGTLPEDVFLALSSRWIYAFDYTPKLVGYEINERVACWPRNESSVVAEYTSTMIYFIITTRSGESHALEVSTLSTNAGEPAVEFFDILGAVDYRSTLHGAGAFIAGGPEMTNAEESE